MCQCTTEENRLQWFNNQHKIVIVRCHYKLGEIIGVFQNDLLALDHLYQLMKNEKKILSSLQMKQMKSFCPLNKENQLCIVKYLCYVSFMNPKDNLDQSDFWLDVVDKKLFPNVQFIKYLNNHN
ncbi:MAG: hypothetical protein ACOWWR_05820 [Eubacteriales bacterium]